MKIAYLYYDGFCEFEIVLTGLIFGKHEMISVAAENREYRSIEGQRFCVDQCIQDVDLDSVDLLVIPGGNLGQLMDNQELKAFIDQLVLRKKKIAGICAGANLLAALGVLKGKRCTGETCGVTPGCSVYPYYKGASLSDEYVVVDGNIITAQGQAYVEFAVELANQMGLYKDQAEYDQELRWFKNIRQ